MGPPGPTPRGASGAKPGCRWQMLISQKGEARPAGGSMRPFRLRYARSGLASPTPAVLRGVGGRILETSGHARVGCHGRSVVTVSVFPCRMDVTPISEV